MKISEDFSVVIPLHNQQDTVMETLESIFNQSRKPAEVIVVDAGSSDDGPERIESRYGDRVRIIYTYTRDIEDLRSLGMQHANSELIGFVDACSTLPPKYLEEIETVANLRSGAHTATPLFLFGARKNKSKLQKLRYLPEQLFELIGKHGRKVQKFA